MVYNIKWDTFNIQGPRGWPDHLCIVYYDTTMQQYKISIIHFNDRSFSFSQEEKSLSSMKMGKRKITEEKKKFQMKRKWTGVAKRGVVT